MYRAEKLPIDDLKQYYQSVNKELLHLIEYEDEWLPALSNAAALLGHQLRDINWVGFYLFKEGLLMLGPFQGKPACSMITLGNGVCGTAACQRETIVVPDVHLFPGHIACDSASQSEIVIPLLKEGHLYGVLDIDSPIKGRFTEADQLGLEAFVGHLMRCVPWEKVVF
ncbi:MAG: GAF domain-containing protein [Thermaerobacter sp.]|nr:GAF domain-containing protein [Thermaerobacter sp.]